MSIRTKLVFEVVGPRVLAKFDRLCEEPMPHQEALLQELLRANADTEYGRRHDFASIQSFSGFQKQVPLTEYEDLEPLIEASRSGEEAQLTRQRPVFYAITSGTTGPSKYIPVTQASRRAKSRLMRIWLSGLFRDHPQVLSGKLLQVFGAETEELAPDGTPCGSEGGHAYRNMPRVVRGLYPVPYEVCEIDDYDARYYTLLRIAAAAPVHVIGTPNPSTIVLLARQLGRHTERLVRDVRDGTLAADVPIEPELRAVLEKGLGADPERAAFLEKGAAAGGGTLLPKHVWPELEILACWKGGTVAPYLDQLDDYFPEGLPVRDLGWLSSECRGSVPLSDDGDSGPLAVGTNVYEFFPADEERKPEPTDLLTVDQIEEGGRYLVYVTTAGGLYRYAMHDILQVTGYHGRTPCVRFVRKEKGIVNYTGEKLTETQVLAAAHDVLDSDGNAEFIAAVGRVQKGGNPHYLFLVEYADPPDGARATETARALDRALARHNYEYASKRRSGRLDAAVLRVLHAGQLDEYQRRSVQESGRDGQFKILRVTDDSSFADEFEEVVGDFPAE